MPQICFSFASSLPVRLREVNFRDLPERLLARRRWRWRPGPRASRRPGLHAPKFLARPLSFRRRSLTSPAAGADWLHQREALATNACLHEIQRPKLSRVATLSGLFDRCERGEPDFARIREPERGVH